MYVLAQMLDATLKYFPRTCADPWCYVIGCFLVHAQTVDVALHIVHAQTVDADLLFCFRRHLMLGYKIFSCTYTGTWCYIYTPSLAFAQALEVIRSSLVLAHLHRRLGLVLG